MTPSTPERGSETILLVTAKGFAIRTLVRDSLRQRGYLVLEAWDEHQAAHIFHIMNGKIDLILAEASSAEDIDHCAAPRFRMPPMLILPDPNVCWSMDELTAHIATALSLN